MYQLDVDKRHVTSCFVSVHVQYMFLSSQVQSIKQNNSVLKQSINEGVDAFKPTEVTFFHCFVLQIPFFRLLFGFSFLPLLTSPQLPPDVTSPPSGAEISLNLLFAPIPSPSPPSFPRLHPQPAPKMNSRWTTEEQLLAVQGEQRLQLLLLTRLESSALLFLSQPGCSKRS